ncbi:MAG: hypothetical protein WA987_11150 [Cellvibrio sp.]
MTEQSFLPESSPQSAPTKPRLAWFKKWVYRLFAFLVGLAILGLLGLWLAQRPDTVLNISNLVHDYFWFLTGFRWSCYGVFLLVVWPKIATWSGQRDGEANDELTTSVLSWRRSFLRIFIVYELFFPFDALQLIGRFL